MAFLGRLADTLISRCENLQEQVRTLQDENRRLNEAIDTHINPGSEETNQDLNSQIEAMTARLAELKKLQEIKQAKETDTTQKIAGIMPYRSEGSIYCPTFIKLMEVNARPGLEQTLTDVLLPTAAI